MELIVFYAVAVAALVSALVAVSHRSPIVNVLSLVVTFFCIAINFALLGAGFLAAAQVLIYAGAILVLFLFVVMLLNAPQLPPAAEPRRADAADRRGHGTGPWAGARRALPLCLRTRFGPAHRRDGRGLRPGQEEALKW
jgi:hypothetical protein